MDISSFLKPEGLLLSAEAGSKRQALQLAARRAAMLTGIAERDLLLALVERERLGTTGVGRGVAIPHARLSKLKEAIGIFVRLRTPVDFESPDNNPVDLLFVLLVPDEAQGEHLRVMARISRLLRDAKACEKMRSALTTEILYAILTADDEVEERDA